VKFFSHSILLISSSSQFFYHIHLLHLIYYLVHDGIDSFFNGNKLIKILKYNYAYISYKNYTSRLLTFMLTSEFILYAHKRIYLLCSQANLSFMLTSEFILYAHKRIYPLCSQANLSYTLTSEFILYAHKRIRSLHSSDEHLVHCPDILYTTGCRPFIFASLTIL